MSEEHLAESLKGTEHGDHEEIHLPPNSWIPVSTCVAMMVFFVGFLPPLSPWGGLLGAVWLGASLVAWYRAARSEYLDLPESGGH